MPTIIVTPLKWARSSLQSYFLGLIVVTGVLIATGISRNPAIAEMGEPYATIWGICLSVGAATALIGGYWREQLTGMLIERSGILLLGGSAALWAILVALKTHANSPATVLFTSAFAFACFRHVRYINQHMNLILKAVADSKEQDEHGRPAD